MKIAAIAANAAQMVIILMILFIRGLDLGALVIFLLFVLMSVPFINFLAIYFTDRPIGGTADRGNEENGLIKREAMRVGYPETRCPVLKTSGNAFSVLDLSEGGVCIRVSQTTPFKKKINGEIHLVSGDRIRFKATVLRREEGLLVFRFTDPIGTALLMEEKKAVAAGNTD